MAPFDEVLLTGREATVKDGETTGRGSGSEALRGRGRSLAVEAFEVLRLEVLLEVLSLSVLLLRFEVLLLRSVLRFEVLRSLSVIF